MSYKIAVIIESMNTYGQGLIRGICRYLNEQPTCTLFFEERTLDSPPPSWLSTWHGDGIIVRDRSGKSCQLALGTGAKVVDLSERRHSGIPTVFSDHAVCSRFAAEHLLLRGFNHFAFVGVKGRPFSEKRRDAFCNAVNDVHLFEWQNDERALASWGNDYSTLTDWLVHLPKPVGIMACYDLAGIGVLQACRLAEISVPDTVAVIGVNNDELQCAMSTPPMSSVAQNQERIGFEACDLLFQLMKGNPVSAEPRIVEPIGVVARRSTDILVVPDSLVVRAIRMIREQACTGIRIEDVAMSLGVSRRTLERRFLKATKRTPHQEMVMTQLQRARELLSETRLPIRVVAKRVGLKSLPHFTQLFTEEIGIRPLEYRRKF
jgi:LacI family transcriptional regulator